MQIKIFQSSKGDCLMISSPDRTGKNRHILVDGGLGKSFREHVAAELSNSIGAKEILDLICVSHIDEDHIMGILEFLNSVIDWRVFDHHTDVLGRAIANPKSPRPPEIGGIWHNAFSEQIDQNTGALESMLANYSSVMASSNSAQHYEYAEIATSVLQGIELSKKIGAAQLGIPLNHHHGGKLIMYRDGQPTISVGKMKIKLIGPTLEELQDLRDFWDGWIEDNRTKVNELLADMADDEDRLDLSDSTVLGNIDKVTESNLASIMLYLYQGHKEILLTGDGHSSHIIRGLELIGKLKAGRGLHVNVLKVQHHGSKNNIDLDFCKRITSDHYIFCGNGSHHNPHLEVLQLVLDSRLGDENHMSPNSQADRPFKFWFNSSSTLTTASNVDQMTAIESLMSTAKNQNGQQFDYQFMGDNESFMILNI